MVGGCDMSCSLRSAVPGGGRTNWLGGSGVSGMAMKGDRSAPRGGVSGTSGISPSSPSSSKEDNSDTPRLQFGVPPSSAKFVVVMVVVVVVVVAASEGAAVSSAA